MQYVCCQKPSCSVLLKVMHGDMIYACCDKEFLGLIQVVAAMHTLGAGEAADAELRKVERQVAPHTMLLGPEVQ